MILVAGGTGRLGREVVTRLREDGDEVRVLSRSGSEGVRCDLRRIPESALEDVDVVVSAVTGFPDQDPAVVDRDGNIALVEAAGRAGADVVLLSVHGAAPDSPMALARCKYEAEQHLRGSDVAWTIIRPDVFVETWTEILERTAGRSHRPLVFGRGDNPFAWVAVGEVADVVCAACTDRTNRGRVIPVLGPERLTLHQLAQRLMASRGWAGEPRHVPRPVLHLMGLAPGRLGRLARASLAMDVLRTPE